MADPLVYTPKDKWTELQKILKTDWPTCISIFTLLDTQKKWSELGTVYDLNVYCPFNDARNGVVAIGKKIGSCDVAIACPIDDTSKLEDALIGTKLIDWDKRIIVPFAPKKVYEAVQRVASCKNTDVTLYPGESFALDIDREYYDISLPNDVVIGPLTEEHAELVNSVWQFRYPTSTEYFKLLISTNSSFGLFKDGKLMSWVFLNEVGNIAHLFTLEEFRGRGYGEIMIKHLSNILLKDKNNTAAYCVKGNENAIRLFAKLGFKKFNDISWCNLKSKTVTASQQWDLKIKR